MTTHDEPLKDGHCGRIIGFWKQASKSKILVSRIFLYEDDFFHTQLP